MMMNDSLGRRVADDLEKITQANSNARSASRGNSLSSPKHQETIENPKEPAIKMAFGQRVETAAKVPPGRQTQQSD